MFLPFGAAILFEDVPIVVYASILPLRSADMAARSTALSASSTSILKAFWVEFVVFWLVGCSLNCMAPMNRTSINA